MAVVFSAASVVEDVLQRHGHDENFNRLRGLDFDSRRAEEAAARRNEAANWLRKMVGIVASKDLPAEPSEEELRLALRSGMILCNVINRVKSGAVPKVVESPSDCSLIPDGAALSAYQYFENVRNFLVAAQEIGVPTFEASDLEQGGISARVVNSILALKSYHEWRQTGGNGVWKFSGNVKPAMPMKQYVRKNMEPFTNSFSRHVSANESMSNTPSHDADHNSNTSAQSLSILVHSLLSDKKPEEIPELVESVLRKVVEEFELRVAKQNGLVQDAHCKSVKEAILEAKCMPDEETERRTLKRQIIFDKQGRDLWELKQSLSATKDGMQFMQMKFQEELNNIGMHIHGLAHAASGYHRVLEQNRKLYNEVQDLKGSIRVYCRIRPSLSREASYVSTVESIDEGNITIKTPSKYGKGHKSFSFNKVFGPSASQDEVFSDMQPVIRSVLDGYNVCIFAYGQTGSGKTYTMTGPRDLTEQTQGVNYRTLSDLFYLVEQRKDTIQYEVSVQMIEIYNEQVRDLLVGDGLNKRYPCSISLINKQVSRVS
ncbi:Kinesin-like protein KIN-14I [Dionaea muscipula]